MAPYVTDVYRSNAQPLAVVRPGSVDELQAVVRTATASHVAIFVRGGGASYTDGYLPSRSRAVLIDMGRLNRIVEINQTDAYVTVEAGTTWKALKDALDPLGLRTPFFGPFSGMAATVGGSMSQHAVSHGSGAHGISAQSMISLDVVIASGALLQTGSRGARRAALHPVVRPRLGRPVLRRLRRPRGEGARDPAAVAPHAGIRMPVVRLSNAARPGRGAARGIAGAVG